MKKIFSLTASIACALAVLSNPILSSIVEAQDPGVMMMDPAKIQKAKNVLVQLAAEDVTRLAHLTIIENNLAQNGFETAWSNTELYGKRLDGTSWNFVDFYGHRHHYYHRPQDQITFVIIIEERRYPDFFQAFSPFTNQFSLQTPLETPIAGYAGIIRTSPWGIGEVTGFNTRFNQFGPSIREIATPYAFNTDVVGAAQAVGLRIEELARAAKEMKE